jgi:hypothetical protein
MRYLMGKRSPDFEKKPRDSYFTIDPVAVNTLALHLPTNTQFIEPCAGGGDLVRGLNQMGFTCVGAYDIEPQQYWIVQKNCLTLTKTECTLKPHADLFITNPPFTWSVLCPLMAHMISLLPTWLLLPADFMHNVRMGPYMKQCKKVVSIGRLYWESNKVKGVDNYCWFLFDKDHKGPTEFIGR